MVLGIVTVSMSYLIYITVRMALEEIASDNRREKREKEKS